MKQDKKITGVQFDTVVYRSPIGPHGGDNFHMTWAANGDQYASLDDGHGWWPDTYYNTRLVRIIGDTPPNYGVDRDVGKYPVALIDGEWYGFGCLAIGDDLYQFISRSKDEREFTKPAEMCKLAYKMTGNDNWYHHDGSPLSFDNDDPHPFWSRGNATFAWISVLQMGRGYELNTDGYVYIYSPNGGQEGTMNQIVMARVQKENILAPDAYEYFRASGDQDGMSWTRDFSSRSVILTFPPGWVPSNFPFGWTPYVIYNPGLRTYIMMASGLGKNNGEMFSAPSCLVMYQAPNPWGPWTLFHKDDNWTADVDYKKWSGENRYVDDDIYRHEPVPELTRLYSPVVSPKWISTNGKTLWLIYSDFKFWLQFDWKRCYNYRFNLRKMIIDAE